MLKFTIIRPDRHAVDTVQARTYDDLHKQIFPMPLGVDHSVIYRNENGGLGIVVEQYGLFRSNMSYFAMRGKLYAGVALLYAFDAAGKTVTLRAPLPTVYWLSNADAVERAITNGDVGRPVIRVNDELLWSWPEPHAIPGERPSNLE
jgi:hypothetical protein